MSDEQIEGVIDALMHAKGCDEMREILAPLIADKARMDWVEKNLEWVRASRAAIDEAMG